MTTQQTTSLAAFLLAQIDADEAVARALLESEDPGYPSEAPDAIDFDERFTPAHVLATCAAHRAIVVACDEDRLYAAQADLDETAHVTTPALRALAAIYADRDGFDPAWVAS